MLKMQPCDVSSRYPDKEKEMYRWRRSEKKGSSCGGVAFDILPVVRNVESSKAPTKWRAQLGSVELCSN